MMRTDLIVYDPVSPLLRAYCHASRLRAWTERAAHADRMEQMTDLVWSYSSQFVDLNERIAEMRLRIASLSKGIPQTELVDDDHTVDWTLSEEERRAQQQILKKAWKYVAQHAHPDKGGSREEFQFLKEAYESGDIRPLTEYILQLDAPLMEQIAYWRSEYERPAIEWIRFRTMNQFQIVQAHMRQDLIRAELLAKQMLQDRLSALEQEYTFLLFHLNPSQMDGNSKERIQDASHPGQGSETNPG